MRESFIALLSVGLSVVTGPVYATEPATAEVAEGGTPPVAESAASASMAEGEGGTPSAVASGEPAPTGSVDPRVYDLQLKYAEAHELLEQYDRDSDAQSLERGQQLLSEWLVEHRALYGDTDAAVDVRRPVFRKLRMAEAALADLRRQSEEAEGEPPPATVTPSSQEDYPPPSSPPPESSRGKTLFRAGLILTISGAAVGITSGALWYGRNDALSDAATATYWVEREQKLQNAEGFHGAAWSTSVMAGVLLVMGVPMLITGGTQRARARQVSVAPQFGRRWTGATVSLRF